MAWESIPEMVLSAGDRFGAAEAGVRPRDRVAISPEWIVATFGITTPSGIPVLDLKSGFLESGRPRTRTVRGTDTADIFHISARTRIAGFKVPRHVEFLAAVPINATDELMKDQRR